MEVDYINNLKIKLSHRNEGLSGSFWHGKTLCEGDDIKLLNERINDTSFTFLDVGANTGSYTFLSLLNPNADFFAFEPNPRVKSILDENMTLNDCKNVYTHQLAISNKNGTSKLRIPKSNDTGLATLGENPLRFDDYDIIDVETITIDDFCKKYVNKPVRCIKIDTEGFEKFVLLGATQIIQTYFPIIILEWNETNMKQCGIDPNSGWLEKFMKLNRYYIYRENSIYSENKILAPLEQTFVIFNPLNNLKHNIWSIYLPIEYHQCMQFNGPMIQNASILRYDNSLPISKVVLESECKVDIKNGLSVILNGGLGNMLFNIATCIDQAEKIGKTPYFCWWNDNITEGWDGHVVSTDMKNLSDIFPSLIWIGESHKIALNDKKVLILPENCGYLQKRTEMKNYMENKKMIIIPDMDKFDIISTNNKCNVFFDHWYWGHNYSKLCKQLDMNPIIKQRAKTIDERFYEFDDNRTTVAVHLRFSGMSGDKYESPAIDVDSIINVLKEIDKSDIFIFSGNSIRAYNEYAKPICNAFKNTNKHITVVDCDDPVVTLKCMMACSAFVLTHSTMGFWGAYLNKYQTDPINPTPTYLHVRWILVDNTMFPFTHWKLFD